MKVRFVGDVHGHENGYWKLVRDQDYSVQIGDMNFKYGFMKHRGLDPAKHKFFGGNHDNYDIINESPHCIGDFGTHEVPGWEHGSFFFVRGAFSIDKHYRIMYNLGWWANEELSDEECLEAYDAYCAARPKIMVTHDCPTSIGSMLVDKGWGLKSIGKLKTRTGELLQSMLEYHRPETWIFGHWHKRLDEEHGGTRFICLPELGYIDL